MTLEAQQAPIDRSIVQSLINTIPEDWEAASMRVLRIDDETGERLSVEISNDAHPDRPVMPDNAIFEELFRSADCFRRHGEGKVWRSLRYDLSTNAQGNWRYQVQFGYDDPASP